MAEVCVAPAPAMPEGKVKEVPDMEEAPETAKPVTTAQAATSPEDAAAAEAAAAHAFMQSAAASALAGVRLGHGGPFGASIVRDGVIIACAHNMVLHKKDPSRHAEMNAIQQACQAIGSHDLSDCDLYTTCEPCPMCWGAVQWSRLGKVHIGVDRHTAAKYGFDDKVFYDEVDSKAGCYGLRRTGYIPDTSAGHDKEPERVEKNMVEVYDGILSSDVLSKFMDPTVNRTMRRRFGSKDGLKLAEAFKEVFTRHPDAPPSPNLFIDPAFQDKHEAFMRMALTAAERGAKQGLSKEREPFGAVIVRSGDVLAEGFNTVLESRDATATAEVNAIRAATLKLDNHSLEGCDLYCTAHPDLMSLGAILWARISRVFCGVSQQVAAQCGFEEGILHFKDLLEHGGREVTTVIEGVAYAECENVFKEWSDRNGVIY
mmetsp:Transcript_45871/g.143715  ORF Transcript_45871/g.143715 Transcript_45871/m.143715 type:complete len:429 (+) Transcript_45871:80-1366(+)